MYLKIHRTVFADMVILILMVFSTKEKGQIQILEVLEGLQMSFHIWMI